MAVSYTDTGWTNGPAGGDPGARYTDLAITGVETGDLLVVYGFCENYSASGGTRGVTTQSGSTGAWTLAEPAVTLESDVETVGGWAVATATGSVTVRVTMRQTSTGRQGVAAFRVPAAEVGASYGWAATLAADTDGLASVTLASPSLVICGIADWTAQDMGSGTTPSGGTVHGAYFDNATFSVWLASWAGQAAGTRDYGPASLTGQDISGAVFRMDSGTGGLAANPADTAGATDTVTVEGPPPRLTYVGAGTFTSGTGALTVPLPPAAISGDLLLLAVESANQTISAPSGWTQLDQVGTGTAAAAGGVRLGMFWRWYASGSVTVADTGDHTTARIIALRNADQATPFNQVASRVDSSATTTFTSPTVTIGAGGMAIHAVALDRDAATTDTELNALTGATLIGSNTVTSGVGGGIGLAYSETAGQITQANGFDTSLTHAYISVAVNLTPVSLGNDPAGASDSVEAVLSQDGGTDHTATPADTAGVTDVVAIERTTTATDTAGAIDTGGPQVIDANHSSADSAGITDTATVATELARTSADTASAGDTVTTSLDVTRTPSDTANILDTATAGGTYTTTSGDTAPTTDTGTATLDAARAVADPAAGTDTAAAVLNAARTGADPAGVADTASTIVAASRTPANPATATDQVDAVLTAAAAADAADQAAAADAAAVIAAAEQILADAAAASDSVTATLTGPLATTAADTATGSDTATVATTAGRTPADTAAASDAVTVAISRVTTADDLLSLIDAATATTDGIRTAADQAAASDEVAIILARVVTIDDLATATDLASAWSVWRDLTLHLTDSAARLTVTDPPRRLTLTDPRPRLTIQED